MKPLRVNMAIPLHWGSARYDQVSLFIMQRSRAKDWEILARLLLLLRYCEFPENRISESERRSLIRQIKNELTKSGFNYNRMEKYYDAAILEKAT